jgi:hypothetical protein
VSIHKEVEYLSAGGWKNPYNRVAYKVYRWQIIFSGLSDGDRIARCSTINSAENIVLAISDTEGIDPRNYRFYDLQTHRGYTSHKDGEFTFNRLILRWKQGIRKPAQAHWEEVECLPEILEEWSSYIWSGEPCGEPRSLAMVRRVLPAVRSLLISTRG